jgi:phage baseplate assembly protein W
MEGMNVSTGKLLGGIEHLRQSVRDILTTPIGSRVMRRDYGSRLFELVDRPINRELILELYAATVTALEKWEPRLKVQRVNVVAATPGAIELDLWARYLPNGKDIKLDGIIVK